MENLISCIKMCLEGDTEVEKLKFEGQNDKHIKFTKLYPDIWKIMSIKSVGGNKL